MLDHDWTFCLITDNASLAAFDNTKSRCTSEPVVRAKIMSFIILFPYVCISQASNYTTSGNLACLTILLPPRMKIVTALELWQSSITSILSLVVPNDSSRTMPALPSLSAVSSLNRGTIRPPVAIAINCKYTTWQKNVVSENSSAQTSTILYSVACKPVSCYLDLRTADPTYGRKLLVQEQVIRLVIKAPLTDDEICTGFLHLR